MSIFDRERKYGAITIENDRFRNRSSEVIILHKREREIRLIYGYR